MPARSGQGGGEREVLHGGVAEAALSLHSGEAQGLLRDVSVQRTQRVDADRVRADVRRDAEIGAHREEFGVRRRADSRANVAAQAHRGFAKV